ncbi:universal stress protein [Corynebacterium sp. 320]|uniref:universal stress protein n=1 Tax=Corynebacterium TaxID=1716 RepID=UPI00125CCB42|nr:MULTISPECIES: universal stress protein [Corynebacterium]KAB1503172.1 universal stress protein [Corynebacterium sp. 320]KAB1550615.1 universal stress protein [Corynebacterium sp. 321]KAB1550976.1 universal stress protein [Corynebacterium sp. 319]KAB3526969.1 universal stress protein [Corynebacterium sp. 250]KAB3538461.1 universal stress protein [Corynebacterium sp. 366]
MSNKQETPTHFNPDADTVLIAFDGSDQSRRAIGNAGRFLSAKNAYILTVWEPIHRQAARAAGVGGLMQADLSTTEAVEEDPAFKEATSICDEGVTLARQAGFAVEPFLVESGSAIWSAIVDSADELNVDLIVMGTRALTGWKSLLQSSVADAIVKNSGRPVLIVPPADEDE